MPNQLHDTAEALVAEGKGILAADESTGTIKKRFDSIDVESTEGTRQAYRDLLFTTPGVEEFVSGVILFDETIRQRALDGTPFPELLAARGIIPGIKVDSGAKPLANAEGETVTEGLDGLRGRLEEYRELGARFAKWRATYYVGGGRPSEYCVWTNAHALARYAALCQEAGHRADRRARGADGRRPHARGTARRRPAARSRRSTPSCTTSASTCAGRCSSRTWCSPATTRPTAPASRRSPRRRSSASTATCRPRCRGSSSSPAASPTRTRPRTSTR